MMMNNNSATSEIVACYCIQSYSCNNAFSIVYIHYFYFTEIYWEIRYITTPRVAITKPFPIDPSNNSYQSLFTCTCLSYMLATLAFNPITPKADNPKPLLVYN